MKGRNAFVNQYRQGSITGATPLQLVIMLYDGALRFMREADVAMAQGDLERQNDRIQRAQRVVGELMSSVDQARGGEIAQNLMALYAFTLNGLVEANVKDDRDKLAECAEVMKELREGWRELEAQRKSEPVEEAPLAAVA